MTYGTYREVEGEPFPVPFCDYCNKRLNHHHVGLVNMGDMQHKCQQMKAHFMFPTCPHCGKDLE